MTAENVAAPPPKRRLVLGASVFVLGWLVTLAMVPVIGATALPTSAQGTISAMVVFIGPKLGMLAAIAIMGKSGFAYLKAQVFGYLKPPAEVSPARHRIGMAAFVAALLLGFLEPYIFFFLSSAGSPDIRFSLAVDLLLIASLFVLGGNFWDKMRALFIREAKAQLPAPA